SALRSALRGETRDAAALREAAAIAASAIPFVDPLQRILELALPVLPTDHVVLLGASADRTKAVILAAAGTARMWRWLRAPIAQGIVARAIETGETQLVAGDADNAYAPAGAGSALVAPVILDGRVLGVLETADERQHVFTQRHAMLLRAFADQCAIALDNARESRL
ncbi:MAG TPA: GAF domain-containing protein, partial [Gaiellaceae bacterium]